MKEHKMTTSNHEKALELLSEDPAERASFDRATQEVYDGDPLRMVRTTLTILSKTAPQGGSYAKVLAICANEISKLIQVE